MDSEYTDELTRGTTSALPDREGLIRASAVGFALVGPRTRMRTK
jgi:hypothetical protein